MGESTHHYLHVDRIEIGRKIFHLLCILIHSLFLLRSTRLWPDDCQGGGFSQFCDASRESTDIGGVLENAGANDLLNYMK